MAKTDTAPDVTPGQTTALDRNTVDERALYLANDVGPSDADSDAKAIVARIMNATDVADVFGGPGSLLASEDLVGVPFTLVDVEYRESELGDGPGVYALLHIQRWGSQNVELATCGARNVMAAAFRGKQLGALPRGPVTLVEGKVTRKGYTPLWLQDMPKEDADKATGIVTVNDGNGDF